MQSRISYKLLCHLHFVGAGFTARETFKEKDVNNLLSCQEEDTDIWHILSTRKTVKAEILVSRQKSIDKKIKVRNIVQRKSEILYIIIWFDSTKLLLRDFAGYLSIYHTAYETILQKTIYFLAHRGYFKSCGNCGRDLVEKNRFAS